MTPREKAEELINDLYEINCKFLKADTTLVRYARYNTLMPLCIESAIFAVDEIINSRPCIPSPIACDTITDCFIQAKKYWEEVKTEIEKQNIN